MRDKVYFKKENMKGKRHARDLAIHPQAKAALHKICEDVPLDMPLFRGEQNKRLGRGGAYKIIKKAAQKAGLKDDDRISCHSLRKTFAGRQYEYFGHDLVATKAAMGHANVNSTMKYLAFEDEKVNHGIVRQRAI